MKWTFESGIPIYLQILGRLRTEIASGAYPPGAKLPPVRELALEAGVNPNTMQRAFAVLETEKLFVTRGTVGRFITTDQAVLDAARVTVRRETVARLVEEARAVGLSPEDLIREISAYTAAQDGADTLKGGQPS